MTSARTKRKGLREAFAARKPRVEHYFLPLADSDAVDEIATRLGQAKRLVQLADFGTDDEQKARVKAELAKVQAEYDACFRRLDFVGLDAPALDAFNTREAERPDDADPDLYLCALIVECLQDKDDVTPEEWLAEVNTWPTPDKNELFATVSRANKQAFSAGIPNG
jgi:hypothetical protein